MHFLFHWGASVLIVLLYAYVIGTLLWLLVVAPGFYKRQRELIRRVEQLEQRIAAITSGTRTL